VQCFCYDKTSSTYIPKSGFTNATVSLDGVLALHSPGLVIGDINNDGTPELLAHNQIVNAKTGAVIAPLPAGSLGGYTIHGTNSMGNTRFPVLADVDNDGILDIVAGNMVYSAQINTGSTAGTVTLKYQAPAAAYVGDGFTSVADIDLDGYLDVVVTRWTSTQAQAYAWSPYKNVLLGGDMIGGTGAGDPPAQRSISGALVGDVDSCGYPEIAFSYFEGMVCYKYDPLLNTFSQLWREPSTDRSAMTAMSMFDFNQDGKQELIYRDAEHLRIIEGSSGDNLTTYQIYSETCTEYPIVVDLKGEGSAQIVVSGSKIIQQGGGGDTAWKQVHLYSFGSAVPGAWAPARHVWNQHGYNVLNVNDTLTIPQYPINPATVFAGPDEILGTADDVRPYNSFLQQQTLLNQYGVPYFPLPNIVWDTEPTVTATISNDSLRIEGCIKNIGDAALQPPIYITFYKNDTLFSNIPTNIIKLDSLSTSLLPDSTRCFTFTFKNLDSMLPSLSSMWISVNDKEGDYTYQKQCETNGRFEIEIPRAKDDYMQILDCYPSALLDVFANDTMIHCDRNEVDLIIISGSKVGATTSVDANNDIVYTLATGFFGRDTIEYAVACHDTIYTAKVFIIVVECPDNVIDCLGEHPVTVGEISEDYIKSTVKVNSYGQPYVGDVDGCGNNEVVIWNNGASGNGRGDAILIFNSDMTLKYEIPAGGTSGAENSPPDLALAFAKTKPTNPAADIFAVVGTSTSNSALKCFTFNNITSTWSEKWATSGTARVSYSAAINIGDINNNGNVMLYVDYKIFNAETGALLLTLPTAPKGKHVGSAPIMNLLADMDNDGTLEAVTSYCVYKLNITNINGESGNDFTSLCLPTTEYANLQTDGFVSVADVNLDGFLDVIVSTGNTTTPPAHPVILVWNTQTIPPSLIGNHITVPTTGPIASRVFAGDVDNDGRPELAVSSNNRIACFKYNQAINDFQELWSKPTNDDSRETYMCMFDFNQDGKQRIVYRDERYLRIIDGATGNFESEVPCFSPTTWEGAVVADLKGDGHAQIIVTGNDVSFSPKVYDQTYLRVYTSTVPGAWAPARGVWNQYSYNAVNINEDLSVPRFQMNPSTIFSNGERPYNAFLKQQTRLNKSGDPLWALPNIQWEPTPPLTATITGGDVVFNGCVKNIGDAALQAPVYVTFYLNDTLSINFPSNILALDSITQTIKPDSTYCFTFTLENGCSLLPSSDIWVSINDKNGDYP
jgi:hypothetical protein